MRSSLALSQSSHLHRRQDLTSRLPLPLSTGIPRQRLRDRHTTVQARHLSKQRYTLPSSSPHLSCHCLGTCFNTSASEFRCECADGWTNKHCETMLNQCVNVTCQNSGVCQPLFRDYRCACSSSDFSGRHCEITAGSVVARQIVSRSFAYVAIVCLAGVFAFMVVLDILKYVFHVDDITSKDRRRKLKGTVRKTKKPAVAIRFQYVS